MNDWVNDLIDKLNDSFMNKLPIKTTNSTGQVVLVAIDQAIINFIKDNRVRLLQIGLDAFKNFLQLWMERKEFEAIVLVYQKLDNTELIAKYREDTIKLAELAVEIQAQRDFWISFGVKVGVKVVGALFTLLL